MATSNNLRITLIATGTEAGTWGTTTNTNLGTIIEDSIAGYVTVSVTSASQALSALDGAADEARNAMIRLTTTTTAAFAVYAPPVSKQYIIWNNSGYAATIYNSTVLGNTTAAGAGVTIANGNRVVIFSNGTDFYEVQSGNVTGTVAIANGGTGQTTANAAFNALAPSQSGQNGRYLKSDGTNASWDAIDISTADITGVLLPANGGTGVANNNAATVTSSGNFAYTRTLTGATNVTFPTTGTLATLSGSETLSNKTLSSPTLTAPVLGTPASGNFSSGTFTWPTFNQNTTGTAAGLSATLAIASGGTGATDAAGARTNLGLGTIATQNSSAVAITGGSITGITDLAIADGGTGASDAAGARTNLGVPSTTGNGATGNWNGITVKSFVGGFDGVFSNGESNSVNVGFGNSTNGLQLWVNRQSSLGLPNEFRNFVVGDGKGAVVAEFTGSTKALNVAGTISQNGTAILTLALQAVYPVGSIYMNATNASNPNALLGFGTWVAFGAGRVPVGFDATNALFDAAEETGGSADAIVVSHTHTATTTITDPGHTHTPQTLGSAQAGSDNGGAPVDASTGYGTGRVSQPTSSATTGITAATTVASSGVSGTNANYQPYITVYMWKRTA